jgi:glycosyltransferase involved in cell wall biosynthesis
VSGQRHPIGVLQVVLNLDPGGTERLVIEICSRLRQRYRIAVCCLEDAGAWAPELLDRGVQVVSLGRASGFQPTLAQKLARVARRHRARIMHCHHYSSFVYGALASLMVPSARVLYTEHGRLDNQRASFKRRMASAVLGLLPWGTYAVSEDLRSHMTHEGFHESRVQVIPNGIPVEPAPDTGEAARMRAECGIPPDARVIGTVGRLNPVKALHILLTAFVRVLAVDPRARLLIIGDGPERARLEQLAEKLRCRGQVHFLGYRSNPRRLIAAMDVYVNSSKFEGISLTILEAMMAGKPVVATRVGGTPEVVQDRTTGILVAPQDPEGMADAISSLLAAPERARTFGQAGRLEVERRFSIEAMVENYAREYERVSGA